MSTASDWLLLLFRDGAAGDVPPRAMLPADECYGCDHQQDDRGSDVAGTLDPTWHGRRLVRCSNRFCGLTCHVVLQKNFSTKPYLLRLKRVTGVEIGDDPDKIDMAHRIPSTDLDSSR